MQGERGVDLTTGELLPPKTSDAVTFMQMAYASAGVKPEDVPVATHWPTLDREKAAQEWEKLRGWVDELRVRFEFLDHHVIPHCWWRHNGHVEALAALRDHELVSFAELAPATAPLDWLRGLRDTAAILRGWTSGLACGAVHQPPISQTPTFDQDAWRRHVEADLAARRPAMKKRPPASASS
jgi:hypothetical protein